MQKHDPEVIIFHRRGAEALRIIYMLSSKQMSESPKIAGDFSLWPK